MYRTFAAVLLMSLPLGLMADPGESTSISVCNQHNPFQLIDALQGNPSPGGAWVDPSGVDVPDGTFVPGVSEGGTYTYTVDVGEGPESSTVEITMVNCPAPPANDNCWDAQFINPANGIPFTTFGATTDGLPHFGEENCEVNGEAQIENDVWYIYAATCDGQATVSTVGGTALNTKIAVYNFNCIPTTNDLLACNDNFGSSYQSSVSWPIVNNGVYAIRIGESPGPGSGNGTFNLIQSCGGEDPPANNLCSDAEVITPSAAIAFSTLGATTDGPSHEGDFTCFLWDDDQFPNDIWYSYTASCDGLASVSTLGGTTLNTRIAVYLGGCPEDLSTLIDCNDDFQGFGQSIVNWDVEQGQEYTIRIGNSPFSNGGAGTFSLEEICGQEPPPNDACEGAEVITPAFGIPFNTFNATTTGPSHFGDETCTFFGGNQIDKDVWYSYTAGCDGQAEFSTVNGTFLDTRLAVYAAFCPENLINLVACNDDVGGNLQSSVTWDAMEGETYYLRLGEFPGSGGGSGTFNLIETCMEDNCVMPVVGYQTMCTGIDDFDGFFVTATVVNIGNNPPYELAVNGTDSTTFVDVPGTYTFGPFPNSSTVSLTLQSLTNAACISGSPLLSTDCYPQNFNVGCLDIDQVFTNQWNSFTLEFSSTWGEPVDGGNCGFDQVHNDLWYFFTAPCTGEATWTNCALSTFNTRMVVYENTCENDDLAVLACSDEADCNDLSASVTFSTFQGSTYVLRLGSTSDSEFGIGVFMIEQQEVLVSAGSDTTVFVCQSNTGSIVMPSLLEGETSGGTWTDDDDTGALLGNVLFLSSLQAPGVYQFTYFVSGPCNQEQATVTIEYDFCDAVATVIPEPEMRYSIYPNPATDVFRLLIPRTLEQLQVIVVDVSGREVFSLQQPADEGTNWEINLPISLNTGLYFVRVIEPSSGNEQTLKLILRK